MENKMLQSKIQKEFPLFEFESAVKGYYGNMTGGKFILKPHDDIENLKES